MVKKIAFHQRSEIEKIQAQWVKLSGLHSRDEWSAVIVRAATAAELAATFAIRREFSAKSQFSSQFVDKLLIWANGLSGKLDKLLLPALQDEPKYDSVKAVCKLARKINDKRNSIVHQGQFCSEHEASQMVQDCKMFIETLVCEYEPSFELVDGQGNPRDRMSESDLNH